MDNAAGAERGVMLHMRPLADESRRSLVNALATALGSFCRARRLASPYRPTGQNPDDLA